MIQNQVPFIILQYILNLLHMALILPQRSQWFMCDQFRLLQQLFEMPFGRNQFIFKVILKLPFTLNKFNLISNSKATLIQYTNPFTRRKLRITRIIPNQFLYLLPWTDKWYFIRFVQQLPKLFPFLSQ